MFCRVEYFSQQTHSCQLAHPGEEDGIGGGGIADFGVGNTNCTGEAEGACDDDDDGDKYIMIQCVFVCL